VRTGEQQELAEFYPKLGDVLKQKFTGWRAYLLNTRHASVTAHPTARHRRRHAPCQIIGQRVVGDRESGGLSAALSLPSLHTTDRPHVWEQSRLSFLC